MRLKLVFGVVLMLVSNFIKSQSEIRVDSADVNQYHISQYTSQQGLMQNSILDMTFDPEGFIWITTWKGVSRFDGRNFKNFNPPKLVNRDYKIFNFITLSDRVLVLNRPYHYIKNGIMVYDTLSNSLDSIYPGNNNQYLSNTNFKYLDEFMEAKSPRFFYLDDSSIYGVDDIQNGWQVTHLVNGKSRNTFSSLDYSDKPKSLGSFVSQSFVSNHGLYWLGYDNVLRRYYQGREIASYSLPWQDKCRLFWSSGHSPFIYRKSTGSIYKVTFRDHKIMLEGVVSNFNPVGAGITRIMDDPNSESIWVGTNIDGLYRMRKNYFKNYIDTEHSDRNSIYTVLEIGKDSLLTSEGVLFTDNGAKTQVSRLPLYNIFKTSDSKLYKLKNFAKINLDKDSIIVNRKEVGKRFVTSCIEDSLGNVWCATGNFVCQYKNDTLINCLRIDLGQSRMYYNRKANQIWICSNDKKRVYVHTVGTESFEEVKLFRDKNVEQIIFTSTDLVLVKVSYEPFYVYANDDLIQLPEDPQGYLSHAHCVVEDKRGGLWLSSDYGIFRTTLSSIHEYLEDRSRKIYYFHYNKDWGFNNNEFNSRGCPCGIVTSKGTIALPSLNGIVEFNPYKVPVENHGAGMVVESMKVDGEIAKINSIPLLPPDFEDLEFKVVHPFYDNTNNIYLSYKLEGYNDEWYKVPKDGIINFSQLAHGNYHLKIQKQSGFKRADTVEVDFPFKVKSFYYESYWFIVLAVVFGLLCIEMVFKWRSARNRKRRVALEMMVIEKTKDYMKLNRELKKNVKKLKKLTNAQEETIRVRREMISIYAHDIRGPLHFIKLISGKAASHILETPIETVKEYLEIINESAKGIFNQTEKMFSWNRAQDEELPIEFKWISLKDVVGDEVKPLHNQATAKNTNIVYEVDEAVAIHTEEDLLRIVVNNLVQNAIKYTEKGSIHIKTRLVKDNLFLQIEDTGIGMDAEQLEKVRTGVNGSFKGTQKETGKAFGLRMVRDILKRLNASINIESKEGEGTTITIGFNSTESMVMHTN